MQLIPSEFWPVSDVLAVPARHERNDPCDPSLANKAEKTRVDGGKVL
jgi:hypothetical protein